MQTGAEIQVPLRSTVQEAHMPRVAAIALDAAEWPTIERLISEGELPALERIRKQSAECRLQNVVPYRSELPWTQFLTGKDAPTNRYWTIVNFDPSTYDVFGVGAYDHAPFYALGSAAKVIALDVPHSVLSEGVNGLQITAWGAHSPQYPRASRPAGLLREMDTSVGKHPGFENDNDFGWYQPEYLDNLSEALCTGASRRIDIVQRLQERLPDWDLLLTVMSESHSVGHHCWHGIDADHPLHLANTAGLARQRLLEVYKALDDAVGRFAEGLPSDATLVVFALHGMQANDNDLPSVILLPELLHRLAFGKPLLKDPDQEAWRGEGFPFLVPAPRQQWSDYMRVRFNDRLRDRVRNQLQLNAPRLLEFIQARRGRSPAPPLGSLALPIPDESDLSPEEIQASRESFDYQPTTWYQRHWPRMRAFVLPTFSDAHVRINLRGRERDGIVAPEDYKQACDEVVSTLHQCTNPRTGRSVVADVVWMAKEDPFAPDGPDSDLVILWTEGIDALHHPEVGTIGPFPLMRTGEHSSNGFALFSGPGIDPQDLGERSAFDLTPTFLSLLGQEPSEDLVGSTILLRAPVSSA